MSELIRAGYIIKDNGDTEFSSKDNAKVLTDEIRSNLSDIKNLVDTYIGSSDGVIVTNNKVKWSIIKYGYKYTFIIDRINKIVGYNQQRKELSLPFYPFIREMDKFKTLYLRVFCEKANEGDERVELKYDTAEEYVNNLISIIDKNYTNNIFKFTKMIVKEKINLLGFEE